LSDCGSGSHLDANGAPISGYGSEGIAALPDGVVATMLQPVADNRLLAIGGTNSEIHVMRLDSTGAMDKSYGTPCLRNNFVNDGDAHVCAGLIRVIPDRLLDSNFEPPPAMPTCPPAQ
jgi:hypothetical protein